MKTLIVIDMQNDFIDGVLGTPEAVAIVPNVKKKIEEYRERGDTVIFTRDTHYQNYLKTQEGKRLPVEHCIVYTKGWDIADDLAGYVKHTVNKGTFGYSSWATYSGAFNFAGSESIELVGLCTDICVISNAMILKSIFPEVPIVVDASCCAGVTPESHKNALAAMKMCQIEIVGD